MKQLEIIILFIIMCLFICLIYLLRSIKKDKDNEQIKSIQKKNIDIKEGNFDTMNKEKTTIQQIGTIIFYCIVTIFFIYGVQSFFIYDDGIDIPHLKFPFGACIFIGIFVSSIFLHTENKAQIYRNDIKNEERIKLYRQYSKFLPEEKRAELNEELKYTGLF